MDFCISLSDLLEYIKSNRHNLLDLVIENIVEDKDLRKIIENEIEKNEPIRQENGMVLNIDFNRGDEDPPVNTFDLYLSGNGYVWIDWGDGTPLEKIKLTNTNVPISHQYEDKQDYVITVYGQENNPNQKISFGSRSEKSENNLYLEKIETWGDLRLVSLSGALNSTTGPLEVPDHLPETVTNLSYLLHDSEVSGVINIGNWDTSKVTDMSWMFYGAENFDGDISNWDTSNVRNMSYMFYGAENFNGDISNWNTSKVTNMSYMFAGAKSFNRNLTNWITSDVRNMSYMFYEAEDFNGDISNWDTSKVKDMSWMFYRAINFNQNLERNGDIWNTSNVENMSFMFFLAEKFDGNISNWNTSKVTDMSSMFRGAVDFDKDISSWNVSSVTNMREMFSGAEKFNQDLPLWDVSSVENMRAMFANAISFNGNITNWNTSSVKDMSLMFSGAKVFDQDISSWNTCSVEDMDFMFFLAESFDQNLSSWKVPNIIPPGPTGFAEGSPIEFDTDKHPDWGASCS